ncbi:MAG: hypothetical protein ACXVP4_09380 [Bacteroidia bacterium]
MRNLYKTILLIFSIYIFPLSAQTYKFETGIIGGANLLLFNVQPDRYESAKEAIGKGVGLQAQYNFKHNYSVLLNFSYEEKSWRRKALYSGYDLTTLNTLIYPLLFKYSIGKKRLFFVEAGPYAGIIMNKTEYYGGNNYYIQYYKTAYEAGASFGLGLSIPIASRAAFTIEVREYLNASHPKNLGSYSYGYSNYNTTNLLLGFTYKFGKREKKLNINAIQSSIDTSKTVFSDTAKKVKERKTFIKLLYSGQMTYRIRTHKQVSIGYYSSGDGDGSFSSAGLSYNSNIEKYSHGFELGFLVEHDFSKHLNINVGFTLDKQGFTSKKNNFIINYSSHTFGSGVINTSSDTVRNQSITYKYNFLTIPLILNYQIKHKQSSFYIGMGLEPKLLIRSVVSFSADTHHAALLNNSNGSSDTNYFNETSGAIFYSANIGVSFPFGEGGDTFFFVEPDFKMELGHTDTTPQLWSAGCRVGIKF